MNDPVTCSNKDIDVGMNSYHILFTQTNRHPAHLFLHSRVFTHNRSCTMMQTASYYSTPSTQAQNAQDPMRTSVNHLLSRAHNIPCTAAAQAFTVLVQPNNRFQVSLDVLLPLLSGNAEVSARIRCKTYNDKWLT